MNGAAITTTLSYFIIMLMSSYKLDKFIQVKSSLIFWLKVIVSAILFILTATIIKESIEMNQFFEGFICLVAGSIVYVVFCFLFRVVEYQDIKKFLENFIKK
jgi:O-antigen/teichoic acid export membrane protein